VPALVAAGVGAAGIVAFSALHVSAWSDHRQLEERCGMAGCSEDEIDGVRTKLVVADVSLGVGIAGVGAAVLLALLRLRDDEPTPPVRALRFEPGFGARGAGAALRGTF
jgi:ABC-type cobalamin transport system permease subunit